MLIRISSWDGRKSTVVKEVKITSLLQMVDEIEWMNQNKICGGLELIAENDKDQLVLDMMNKYYGKEENNG